MIGIPERVQSFADEATRVTGVECSIESVSGYWRVTIEVPRVVATARFRHTRGRGGRWSWCDGTLLVDGQPRPTTKTFQQLARLIADPDCHAEPLEPLAASEPPRNAPAAVQRDFWAIARRLGHDVVTLGLDGNDWVIALESPGKALRNRYLPHAGRWLPDPYQPFTVVVDGRDRTPEINDLAGALALLMDQSEPGEPGSGAATGPATGTGFGSVDVRRHSVIRN